MGTDHETLMQLTDLQLYLLLGALCFAPLVVVLLLGFLPMRVREENVIVVGNPLLNDEDASATKHILRKPLLHVMRVLSEDQLRELILGLRFLPVAQTAPFLKRYLGSSDAELQLYSQSILQNGQEKLQATFTQMQTLAMPESPANVASFLGAGLRLLASPLTPESEHASILQKMQKEALQALNPMVTHPRLVHEAACFFIRTKDFAAAYSLLSRLPAQSPLHESLNRLLQHHYRIARPPEPHSVRYQIR